MADAAPHRETVLLALERLLAWPEMMRSQQLGSFLSYIVHRTLDGEAQTIKAYSIAVDVFGRPPGFDPQADPIVRVQARRLRGLLNAYYDQAGSTEAVQIRLPTGRYVPEFVTVAPQAAQVFPVPVPAPVVARSRAGIWTILAALALILAIGAFSVSRWLARSQTANGAIQAPSITIVEFANLADAGIRALSVAGLAIELVTDLEQFDNIDVRYGGSSVEIGDSDTGSDFVLTGIVRRDDDVVQYSGLLTDTRTNSAVWDHTVTVPDAEAHQPRVLDDVSRSIALILGSPRGPLHAKGRALALASQVIDTPETLYWCRTLFALYRERANIDDAERALECVSGLSEADRTSPIGLALGANLRAETIPQAMEPNHRTALFAAASAELDRAVRAAPASGFVWEQHARLQETMGNRSAALTNYSSAIQLNPANGDALAAYGRLLALTGATEEARPLVRMALQGTPNPPAWYHGGAALVALADRDFVRAIALAERYVDADRDLGTVLALVAGQGVGDAAIINRYLPQVLEMPSFRSEGILPRLRDMISDEALIALIGTSLVAAGLPEAALEQGF